MPSAAELEILGQQLHASEDYEGARLYYLAALGVDPTVSSAMENLALVLADQGQFATAIACMERTKRTNPSADWLSNYGNLLMRAKRFGEAGVALTKAVQINPESPGAWHNMGLLCASLNKYAQGLSHLERAKSLGSNIERDWAFLMLCRGDLNSALEAFESRWTSQRKLPPWEIGVPEWTGQDLTGKNLLLHCEQGFGDSLMTARFWWDLVKRGTNVTFAVPPALVRLFRDLEAIDVLSLTTKDAKRFDFHSPTFSAMRWLGVERKTIDPRPYLSVPKIVTPAVNSKEFNVGICWASGDYKNYEHRRYVPLEFWLPLATVPGVRLHCVQKNEENSDIQKISAEALISDQTHLFSDFADAAAFIDKLDLVISVDSAVVHLAGAMGKPVWMLSQFTHCWRWWDIENGNGRPWYDRIEILWQKDALDWKPLLHECKERLLTLRSEQV